MKRVQGELIHRKITQTTSRRTSGTNELYSESIRQARMQKSSGIKESQTQPQIIEDIEHKTFKTFMKNFHQVECRHFEIDPKDVEKCKCGELKKNHQEDLQSHITNEWREQTAMQKTKTKCYGKIEFFGEDVSNTSLTMYARINDEDNIKDVKKLLFEYWNIKIGTLCISVIGGAKNFKLRKREKEIFIHGLMKAAQTTNALIITSGLNLGITKVVGDAINEGLYDKKENSNPICCLGISPWGYVLNRKHLENNQNKICQYKVSNKIESKQPVSLNPHHTHYLFVDEGKRNGFKGTNAGQFRAKLEQFLKSKYLVVLLIVEGGEDIFEEAKRSVDENVPIVICDGTGRASDILGDAYREVKKASKNRSEENSKVTLSENFKKSLEPRVRNIMTQEKDKKKENEKLINNINHIEEIVAKSHLVTIFDMKTGEDLDLAILYSLIKSMNKSSNKETTESVIKQIQLCLTWHRADIARDRIFTNDVTFKSDTWTEFLTTAFISGQVDFIEVFLNNGGLINEFLTVDMLTKLYLRCNKRHYFDHTSFYFLRRRLDNLADVTYLLSVMIGCKIERICSEPMKLNEQSTDLNPSTNSKEPVKNPFQELFIWSVLMEKHDIAKFIWEKCENCIFLALVATKLYRAMDRASTLQDTDRQNSLKYWKEYFENLAIKVLEECHEMEPESAAYLIERENSKWGNLNCLELAFKAKDQKFISCVVCQNSIDFIWRTGLHVSLLRCIFAIFFPCFLLDNSQRIMGSNHQAMVSTDTMDTDDNTIEGTLNKNNSLQSTECHSHDSCEFDVDVKSYSCCQLDANTLRLFYSTPQTKFCIHFLVYLFFLIYFSIVVLFLMRRKELVSHEYIYIVYLICLILDKLMEIATFNGKDISISGRDWIQFSHWNKLDICVIITSFLGVLLGLLRLRYDDIKTKDDIYRSAKTFYSLTVGLFYLRCLRFLTLHPNLGPKMVMIGKMIKELILYLCIIVIILLSYGVTSQAAYYTERPFNVKYLGQVVEDPYWALFGELNVDSSIYLNYCSPTNFNETKTCPQSNPLISVLFAVYIFIGNILLLNVLIAIFSYIFQEIHENSIDIWKFSMYSLVKEYEMRPFLPPPFSFLERIILMFDKCCSHCRSKNKISNQEETENAIYRQPSSRNMKRMSSKRDIAEITFIENQDENDTMVFVTRRVHYVEVNSQRTVLKKLFRMNQKTIESLVGKLESHLKGLNIMVGNVDLKMENLYDTGLISAQSMDKRDITKQSTTSMESPNSSKDDHINNFQVLSEVREIKNTLDNLINQNEIITRNFKSIRHKLKELKSKSSNLTTVSESIYENSDEEAEDAKTQGDRKRLNSKAGNREQQIMLTLDEQRGATSNLDRKLDEFKQQMISSFRTLEYVLQDSRR